MRSARSMVEKRCAMITLVRSAEQLVQGVLQQELGLGIHTRRRLVQHQDGRIIYQRPGNGQELTLAVGQVRAALADRLGVAGRQRAHEAVDVRPAGRRLDVRPRHVALPQGEVLLHGAGEDHHILEDEAHVAPQRGRVPLPDVDSLHQHGAALDVVAPCEELRQRALPRPAGTDHREPLAGRDAQGEPRSTQWSSVAGRPRALVVREPHVAQLDRRRGAAAGGVGRAGAAISTGGVEEPEDPLGRRPSPTA